MGKFLAKVGRDPKTCAAQIAAFCQSGTAGDDGHAGQHTNAVASGGSRPKQNAERRRGSRVAADGSDEETRGESKSAARGEEKNNRRGGRQQQRVAFAADGPRATAPSMASLPETLAAFGFVFEGTGAAVKPSVAEAFAMLRLHAQPVEARAAGEAAKRYSSRI